MKPAVRALPAVFAVSGILAAELCAGPVAYTVLDLHPAGTGGSSWASGINEHGQVAASVRYPAVAGQSEYARAYRTAPNSPINPTTDDLGSLGRPFTYATGINESGQVIGYDGPTAVIYIDRYGTTPTRAFRTAPNQGIDPATDDLGSFGLLEAWKMKRSVKFGAWRPAGGAILVGALAFAVGAYAAPRNDAAATKTGTVRTDSAALVTGSVEHMQSVVAGTPPTIKLEYDAVAPPAGSSGGTYTGANIDSAGKLILNAGGTRAWFYAKISDWDPAGDNTPTLQTVQWTIDASGYRNGVGTDLGPDTSVPCVNAGPCIAAFGDSNAACDTIAGRCLATYIDKAGNRADGLSWCRAQPFASPCNQADCGTASLNYNCFSIYDQTNRPDQATDGNPPPPDGRYYLGSLVLSIPAGAKGTYAVNFTVDGTTFCATGDVPPQHVPILSTEGVRVTIQLGKCCFGLGTAQAGCSLDTLEGECDAQPQPSIWTPSNRPGGTNCSVCAECPQAFGLEAWRQLVECYDGVGVGVEGGCGCFDPDDDGDVDLLDVAEFLVRFDGG